MPGRHILPSPPQPSLPGRRGAALRSLPAARVGPPLPHPAAGWGSLTFRVAPDYHPRRGHLVRPRSPRHRLPHTTLWAEGKPREGVTQRRRGLCSPRARGGRPGALCSGSAPHSPAGARAAAPPRPLQWPARPRPRPAPRGRCLTPRARRASGRLLLVRTYPLSCGRARSRPVRGDPERRARRFGAGEGRSAPPRARPHLTPPSAGPAPPRHVTISLARAGGARGGLSFGKSRAASHPATSAPAARVFALDWVLLSFSEFLPPLPAPYSLVRKDKPGV